MFTDQEMSSLKFCAEDQTLEDHDREMINSVMHKIAMLHSAPKPQILVTINGGVFQFAHANMDIELVIEDQDNIVNGDDLYYPCLAGDTQEEFDRQVQKAYEQVLKEKARKLKDEPVTEVRIFIHDSEDSFPYNVAVNGDVIATYGTFDEARYFLDEYLFARKP